MNIFLFLLYKLIIILEFAFVSCSEIDSINNSSWRLVWSDEFNDPTLNTSDWSPAVGCGGWGNRELECYTSNRAENARIENGSLVIEARVEPGFHLKTSDGTDQHSDFTSARLNSRHAWVYGKFEARARMARGNELWPAIWMMPQHSKYGAWAASGEIDIMELRGNNVHEFSSTIHYGGNWPNNIASGSGFRHYAADLSADFHTYGIEWEPKQMRWYFDGVEYHRESLDRMMWSHRGPNNPYTKNGQPFDQPFNWILNVAVGGTFFGSGPYITPEQARKEWPKNTLEVDYVRVYQK